MALAICFVNHIIGNKILYGRERMVMNSVRAFDAQCSLRSVKRWTPGRMASLRQVIDPAVAAVFKVDVHHLRSNTRGSTQTAFARQVAMYLAHVVCGLSLTEVGRLFAR